MFLAFLGGIVLALGCCIVLPILAFLRTRRIHHLEHRLAGVEAALLRLMRERTAGEVLPERPAPPPPRPAPARAPLDAVIGQRWLGWIAVLLIFLAAAFFLKYAFDNRWIGELGRVTLGITVGLCFVWGGLERHRRGWPYLSQVLTGGGAALIYLSLYASFGFYDLIAWPAAFTLLAIVVVQTNLLAWFYNAPSIAGMGLAGGLLVPVLLDAPRDPYLILFGYLVALNSGVLGILYARRWQPRWRWLGSVSFVATHLLYWAWHAERYHIEKRPAALAFQAAVFVLFVLADLLPRRLGIALGVEEWLRLITNAFVFYATCYALLFQDYRVWMGAFALAMAALYAALGRLGLRWRDADPRALRMTLGAALLFVTLALPIQLADAWISIAWAVEAVVLLWVGWRENARPLRWLASLVFGLAMAHHLVFDTPWQLRAPFTPVLNSYFLATAAIAACLLGATLLNRRCARRAALSTALLAVVVVWIGTSIETSSYFDVQLRSSRDPSAFESVRQAAWSAQLALSLLWSIYAAALTAVGFRLRLSPFRWAGLILFAITLLKVFFFDIARLRQFYRIVAVLALGILLLAVTWAYQRIWRREQGS